MSKRLLIEEIEKCEMCPYSVCQEVYTGRWIRNTCWFDRVHKEHVENPAKLHLTDLSKLPDWCPLPKVEMGMKEDK